MLTTHLHPAWLPKSDAGTKSHRVSDHAAHTRHSSPIILKPIFFNGPPDRVLIEHFHGDADSQCSGRCFLVEPALLADSRIMTIFPIPFLSSMLLLERQSALFARKGPAQHPSDARVCAGAEERSDERAGSAAHGRSARTRGWIILDYSQRLAKN